MNQEVKSLIYHTTIKVGGDMEGIKTFLENRANELRDDPNKERYKKDVKDDLNDVIKRLDDAAETGEIEQDIRLNYSGGYTFVTIQEQVLVLELYLVSEWCDAKELTKLVKDSLEESGIKLKYVVEE